MAAQKSIVEELTQKNKKLAAEVDSLDADLKDAAQYFFVKGRVDDMRDPAATRC